MKFGISDITHLKLKSVFHQYPEIEEVVLYGSRAKGNFRSGSDIDISLIGEHITADIRSKICQKIDSLNTPYLFDISVFHSINSESLKDHIRRIGELFYSKENMLYH